MTDPCAVVSGVSKGLGESIAAHLLARGFEVIGLGRSAAPRLSSPSFRLERVDLADVATLPAIVERLFESLAARPPASIAVVNNAAVAWPAAIFGRLAVGELREALDVNLAAPMIIANAFVRAFRDSGGDRRLVNVSSGAAVHPIAGAGVYNVAKAGLEMLTAVVAAEQGRDGIRAITVRPGIIDTPMQAFIREQPIDLLPSRPMFDGFHANRELVPPDVTAAKIVDRLIVGAVEQGRVYSYAEL